MLRAHLRGLGADRDACIVDISSNGLAATADHPPRQGDYVELVIGDIVLVGQVKWTNMRRFGMQFRERISVNGLLSGEQRPPEARAAEAVSDNETGRDFSGLFTRVETAMIVASGAMGTLLVVHFLGHSLL